MVTGNKKTCRVIRNEKAKKEAGWIIQRAQISTYFTDIQGEDLGLPGCQFKTENCMLFAFNINLSHETTHFNSGLQANSDFRYILVCISDWSSWDLWATTLLNTGQLN